MIQIDTREKGKAIKLILSEFEKQNVKSIRSKLYVGDYMDFDNPRLVIDRKQNLLELCTNLCQDNKRFINELKKAKDSGIRIIFLVEHGAGINSLEDVQAWVNPRLKTSPLAVSGTRLYKKLCMLIKTYDIDFMFCNKRETGTKILELLQKG